MSRTMVLLFLSISSLAFACGDDGVDGSGGADETLEIPEGCNPLAYDKDCLLPFPSNFFLSEGKVTIPDRAALRVEDSPIDFYGLHRPDGFSIGAQILSVLGEPIEESDLVAWYGDVGPSTTDASVTVLYDPVAKRRIAHFAEVDPLATDPARQALVIRPLERLEFGTRYIVALRGIRAKGGGLVASPKGFANLRDANGKGSPTLAAMSARFEAEVFAPLAEADIPREELQLAWDFTTQSEDGALGDMKAVRARFDAPTAPEVTVVKVEENVNANVGRRVELTIRVPLFMEDEKEGAKLHYEGGVVTENGFAEVPMTVWIPRSVTDGTFVGDVRLVQYGHGFFGERIEIDGFPSELANEKGYVIFGVDWWGMSRLDVLVVADKLLNDPASTMIFTDRVHQGMANAMAAADVMTNGADAIPELEVNGVIPWSGPLYFYGISQGHILGGTYYALSPYVHRAAMEVGGANIGMMMFRAQPFAAFLSLLASRVPDPLDHQKFVSLVQPTLDRIDPLSYAPWVLTQHFPNGDTDRAILLRAGIGDISVPNIATYLHAKAVGVPLFMGPSAEEPSFLEKSTAPTNAALTIFDLGAEPYLPAEPPPGENPVHEGVRKLNAAKNQLDAFFRPNGEIIDTCDGVCDPE